MTRPKYTNLNGLWEFQSIKDAQTPTFGKQLNETILVPFPVESCLSGLKDHNDPNDIPPTYQHMWYRTTLTSEQLAEHSAAGASGKTLLHFGAVDWKADVYVNGIWVGSHSGGYDGFNFDITEALGASSTGAEIWVTVFDPSNMGAQPFGKQRITARYSPGGDTYTPVSGIWQTVWMETVPATYISGLKISADMKQLTITTLTNVPDASAVTVTVTDSSGGGVAQTVATGACKVRICRRFPGSVLLLLCLWGAVVCF